MKLQILTPETETQAWAARLAEAALCWMLRAYPGRGWPPCWAAIRGACASYLTESEIEAIEDATPNIQPFEGWAGLARLAMRPQ